MFCVSEYHLFELAFAPEEGFIRSLEANVGKIQDILVG